MQLRALMYFDELVRTNSMRAAAENLNVAATAVSRQIENLEHYFGTPLVERSNRGIKLTAAGELLAARAGRTLRELEHVHQLIDDLQGLQRGKVVIYANGATVANLIAPVLAEFSLRYPKLRFEVAITSAREAVEALAAAEADLVVTLFAPKISGVKVRLRSEITYDVIMAADHPSAGARELTLRDLVQMPLALPDKNFGARQAFEELFAKDGLELDPVFVTGSLEMLKEPGFAPRGGHAPAGACRAAGNRRRPVGRSAAHRRQGGAYADRSLRRARPAAFLRRRQARRFHRALHARRRRPQIGAQEGLCLNEISVAFSATQSTQNSALCVHLRNDTLSAIDDPAGADQAGLVPKRG